MAQRAGLSAVAASTQSLVLNRHNRYDSHYQYHNHKQHHRLTCRRTATLTYISSQSISAFRHNIRNSSG
jgi:hypothetical protein